MKAGATDVRNMQNVLSKSNWFVKKKTFKPNVIKEGGLRLFLQ